jgi:hypothetical protein
MQIDIDVLVERGGYQEAGVAAIVRRQVRAASAEGYAQGTTSDYHGWIFL